MKVVIFGSSKYIIPTIEKINTDYDLCLVVTTEKEQTEAVPSYCSAKKIPFISVKTLRDKEVLEKIREKDAEVAVLGYFGLIIPQELLSIFPKGIVNIHPSLLPKYRGPTPVQTAILNGDKKTGVSIILLDNEVDHGPILFQKEKEMLPSDTTDSLHEKLFSLGAELVEDVLPKYLQGELQPIEQDHKSATFTKQLSRNDGHIDIDSPPAKDKLNRMIRAYFPWPGSWTLLHQDSGGQAKNLRVKLLPENKIQMEGGKPMSIKDFINGYPELKQAIGSLLY
jgi:methionyl-tRNA formyltransferase